MGGVFTYFIMFDIQLQVPLNIIHYVVKMKMQKEEALYNNLFFKAYNFSSLDPMPLRYTSTF